MSLIDLSQAIQSIATSKLRTMLNTLGIVVGVAVTVIFVSTGESARQYVKEQVESVGFGANAMVIHPGKVDPPVEPSRLSFDDARKSIDTPTPTSTAAGRSTASSVSGSRGILRMKRRRASVQIRAPRFRRPDAAEPA